MVAGRMHTMVEGFAQGSGGLLGHRSSGSADHSSSSSSSGQSLGEKAREDL